MKEEIMTCVPRQQVFNLQTYNQFLYAHTANSQHQIEMMGFEWVDFNMFKSKLLCFNIKSKTQFS